MCVFFSHCATQSTVLPVTCVTVGIEMNFLLGMGGEGGGGGTRVWCSEVFF